MEEGLVCIDDYLNILDIWKVDFDGREAAKAKFVAALIFLKNNEFKAC